MAWDAHGPHLQAGEVEVGVVFHNEVGRHGRVEAIAAAQRNMVLQRVRHFLAAHKLRPGDDAPQVSARRVVAMLMGRQDELDARRVEADGLDRRPLGFE